MVKSRAPEVGASLIDTCLQLPPFGARFLNLDVYSQFIGSVGDRDVQITDIYGRKGTEGVYSHMTSRSMSYSRVGAGGRV